jgi:PAS domain S-box-containing protein
MNQTTINRPQMVAEALNRSILDAALDCIITIDAQSHVIEWNRAAEATFGYSRDEVVGRHLGDIIVPEAYRQAHADGMRHYLETGEGPVLGKRIEVEAMRRDGTLFPVELAINAVHVDAQVIFTAYLRDISERLRSDAVLRETEEQFRSLTQAVPHHVWIANPDGELYWFNDRVYESTGAEAGTLSGGEWLQVVHADDRDRAVSLWMKALGSGDFYEIEFRLWDAASKDHRWHLARALPVRAEDGRVLRWIGTNTDIHDQKMLSSRLVSLNSELERYAAERSRDHDRLWRISQELMLVAGYDGIISSVNPSAERMLGWKEADMIGKRLDEFIHPEDIPATMAEMEGLARGATTLAFENRYRHRNGTYRTLNWTAVPSEGFVHALARDVTAEREADAQLRQMEEALRQSQKMEAVGQLTGGIAHDFNNLLQGITGSLDLIQRRIAQGRVDEAGKFVDAAMLSANRAAALTHRLLAFSRRQPLDPKPVDPTQLVVSVEDLLRRTLGERITLEISSKGDTWLTRCDPNQLESALLNLAINARDAMPEGGSLTIATANLDLTNRLMARMRDVEPGEYVRISVTDTGTGMDQETAERAFEPFFTTKPLGKGTGLGLSMIYGFARQSEGQIRILSALGHGTTIELMLPRYIGALPSDPAVQPAQDRTMAPSGQLIVVVEDEETVRTLVATILKDHGYTVITAADGPSGLKLIEETEGVDLLLSDIGLPGMSGRQLVDAARARQPGLKVVFMTGYAESATGAGGFLDAGMELVTKPVSLDVLLDKVRNLLANQKS